MPRQASSNEAPHSTGESAVWRFLTNRWFLFFLALAVGITLGILCAPALLPYVFALAETSIFASLELMTALYTAGVVVAVTAGAAVAATGGVLKVLTMCATWTYEKIFGNDHSRKGPPGDGPTVHGQSSMVYDSDKPSHTQMYAAGLGLPSPQGAPLLSDPTATTHSQAMQPTGSAAAGGPSRAASRSARFEFAGSAAQPPVGLDTTTDASFKPAA